MNLYDLCMPTVTQYEIATHLGLKADDNAWKTYSSVKMKLYFLNSIVSFNGGKVLVRAVDPKEGSLEERYQGAIKYVKDKAAEQYLDKISKVISKAI